MPQPIAKAPPPAPAIRCFARNRLPYSWKEFLEYYGEDAAVEWANAPEAVELGSGSDGSDGSDSRSDSSIGSDSSSDSSASQPAHLATGNASLDPPKDLSSSPCLTAKPRVREPKIHSDDVWWLMHHSVVKARADLAKFFYEHQVFEQESNEIETMFENLKSISELKPMLANMTSLARSRAEAYGANSRIFQKLNSIDDEIQMRIQNLQKVAGKVFEDNLAGHTGCSRMRTQQNDHRAAPEDSQDKRATPESSSSGATDEEEAVEEEQSPVHSITGETDEEEVTVEVVL